MDNSVWAMAPFMLPLINCCLPLPSTLALGNRNDIILAPSYGHYDN